MTAIEEAACILAKLHPRMWACSSCRWRSAAARAVVERDAREGRTDPAAPPATPDPDRD